MANATVNSQTEVIAYSGYYTSGGRYVAGSLNNATLTGTQPSSSNFGEATVEGAQIESGATATGDKVGELGLITLATGGTGVDLTALTSGTIFVSGGALNGGNIDTSAALLVGNGGIASGVAVASAAIVYVGDVGSVTNTSVINGYTTSKGINVTGTGIISGGTLAYGAVESMGSGGTDKSSLVQGTQYVSGGAVTISDTVNSGGLQNLLSGANTTSTTVGSGGTTVASSGAHVSATTVSGGTVMALRGAAVMGGTVESGGTMVISSGATGLGVNISSGGTEVVMSGGTVSGGTVYAGGTEIVSAGGTAMAQTIASGGSLLVATGSVLTGTIVTEGAIIDVDNLAYVSGGTVHLSGNTLTVTEGGSSWSTTLSGTFTSSDYFVLGQDADGSTKLTYVCFCEGTMIRTENGEEAVENLQIGDSVLTLVDGKEVASTLTWVGRRTANVRTDLPVDQAGYPVRILKDAIAANVPSQDLLVTAEHCLYLDGVFVPARMLVNGRSVFYDLTMTHYNYFHVETERHSILWSNGALTESYLATGNRRDFGQQRRVARLVNRNPLDWAIRAAAPLGTSREIAEPIFRALEARAAELEIAQNAAPICFTDDADLHLVTASGHRLNAIRKSQDGQVMFMLPSGTEEARIVSRASRPSDTVGPFVDDRRELGVLVGRVTLWNGRDSLTVSSHLEDGALSGWDAQQEGGFRWTSGNAKLALPNVSGMTGSLLALEIRSAGPYVVTAETAEKKVLAS